MPKRVVDLFELIEIDEVNGAHVVAPPLRQRASSMRSRRTLRLGSPVNGIESRQLIDLGLGNLSLGDVLDQNDHAAVFHRLHREFERAPIRQLGDEGGVVAAGKALRGCR